MSIDSINPNGHITQCDGINNNQKVKPQNQAHTDIIGKSNETKQKTLNNINSNKVRTVKCKNLTSGEINKKLGINCDDYPKELQNFIKSNSKYLDNKAHVDMLKLVLSKYMDPENTHKDEDIEGFFNEMKETFGSEKEKIKVYNELMFNKELFATTNQKPTRNDKASAISKVYGGQVISASTELEINGEKVNLTTKNTPQKLLSGFHGDTNLQQYSSEFQGKKTAHASNLWKQDICVRDKQVSFIRSGNTRGGEQPAKEILANALALKYPYDENLNRFAGESQEYDGSKERPFPLRFSNVQLMTPGIIADKNMPLHQMETFEKLSNHNPLKLNYQGKEVYVKLEKPLLFNFPTNAQGHSRLFKPLANFKEIDKRNETSYNTLESIVKEKLADANVDETTRKQINNLWDQINVIYKKNKHGLEKNPYALPSRVALLTNLLGYATSYGCKSGKDRTGVMSMELETLTAKVLVDNTPYDPNKLSDEEKKNLQSVYKSGSAIEIAKINTGDVQNNLKIKHFKGVYKSDKERFGVSLHKDYNENLKKF